MKKSACEEIQFPPHLDVNGKYQKCSWLGVKLRIQVSVVGPKLLWNAKVGHTFFNNWMVSRPSGDLMILAEMVPRTPGEMCI